MFFFNERNLVLHVIIHIGIERQKMLEDQPQRLFSFLQTAHLTLRGLEGLMKSVVTEKTENFVESTVL